MNSEIRVFLNRLLILTAVLGAAIVAFMLLAPKEVVSPTLPFLLIFHAAATLVSYMYIQKRTKNAPNRFIQAYLGNTTFKLLLYLAILFLYALNNLSDAVNFIISFFLLYVIYTIFEVVHLIKAGKQNVK